ncbi:hypothetical protein [Paenibacillus pini]
MKRKAEGYTRLSISVVMFTLACLMPNTWSIILVSFVALYSLVSGLIRIKS